MVDLYGEFEHWLGGHGFTIQIFGSFPQNWVTGGFFVSSLWASLIIYNSSLYFHIPVKTSLNNWVNFRDGEGVLFSSNAEELLAYVYKLLKGVPFFGAIIKILGLQFLMF